ncbi:MAG TPA: EVE domain-containing protein [Gemmatimonadaceae bacterium]|nr:EVE domain-containing protein [Gemmatimonadaceae bacterium]
MTAPHRRWLVKSEADCFSWNDLWKAPRRTTHWDGVRNYQARNMLRDQMKTGDLVFFYHSNGDPNAIVGVCEVTREGYPDFTAFDPKEQHFDPKSDPDHPTWYMVDLKAVEPFRRPVTLTELRSVPGLERMALLQKGSRLSVQPVSEREWEIVYELGTRDAGRGARDAGNEGRGARGAKKATVRE